MKLLLLILSFFTAQVAQMPPMPAELDSSRLSLMPNVNRGTPPLPGGRPAVNFAITTAATIPVTISWDPNPPDQQVSLYTVQISTTITGPFNPVISTTNSSVQVNLARPLNRYFIQVIPTDWWGQQPTNGAPLTVATPATATPVQNIHISK